MLTKVFNLTTVSYAYTKTSLLIAAGGTHAYWAINILANGDGTYAEAAELEMHSSIGGSNICSGGTPIASSYYGGDVPANAFDGNLATVWASSGAAYPQWIGYQFASPVGPIVEFVWTPGSGYGNRSPSSFQVIYSDDGSTWSVSWTGKASGWSDSQVPQTLNTGFMFAQSGDGGLLWQYLYDAPGGGGGARSSVFVG
jgi:hypothetical protein